MRWMYTVVEMWGQGGGPAQLWRGMPTRGSLAPLFVYSPPALNPASISGEIEASTTVSHRPKTAFLLVIVMMVGGTGIEPVTYGL